MTQHILKLPEPYFSAVASKAKTFEARRNDRAYQTGDSLLLYDSSACDCSDPFCDKRRPALLRVVTFVFAAEGGGS